jgi:5'-3' exonuclease
MGIPYYFANLVRKHKHVVTKLRTLYKPQVLAFDLNCLVHKYIDPTNPVPSVIAAIRTILETVCTPTHHLLFSLDGKAPYGKIVQQRYRRFKMQESSDESFDRNQISPDTPFMRELSVALRTTFPHAVLQDTLEEGEGEHKILQWLRTLPEADRKEVCIYGLDADLILLCLGKPVSLLREMQEFNLDGQKEGFSLLSIPALESALPMAADQYLRLCLLCFGNDFMCPLGMFSLREGGYERALAVYEQAGRPNLKERRGIEKFLQQAAKQEAGFYKSRSRTFAKEHVVLRAENLEQAYSCHILDGVCDLQKVVDAFWKTYDWTCMYMETNECPDWTWVYPYAESPLVCTLAKLPYHPSTWNSKAYTITQQLQCILPKTSLHTARRISKFADEWYSEETDMRVPWMRRYTWESEPYISVPWNPHGHFTSVKSWAPQQPAAQHGCA